MAAKKSLMESMQPFDNKASSSATMEPQPPQEIAPASQPAPSRRGKRAITGYVAPDAFKQFKILQAERDKDGQQLIEEALNDLFKKYGKPAIA